jgi:hypothetical protein
MPPLPLIQTPPRLSSLPTAPHPVPMPALFRAVAFDYCIIHGQHYTWETWQTAGRWAYPTCQPVTETYLNRNSALFAEFVDARRGER